MKVIGLAIREKTRAPMKQIHTVAVTCSEGLIGDSRGRPGSRQVTLLSEQQWQEACNELNQPLPWTYRRANILVSGVNFGEHLVGRTILIGELRLEVTGETDPCPRMDEQYQGLTRALEPDYRGGVTCKVVSDGQITLGQGVQVI